MTSGFAALRLVVWRCRRSGGTRVSGATHDGGACSPLKGGGLWAGACLLAFSGADVGDAMQQGGHLLLLPGEAACARVSVRRLPRSRLGPPNRCPHLSATFPRTWRRAHNQATIDWRGWERGRSEIGTATGRARKATSSAWPRPYSNLCPPPALSLTFTPPHLPSPLATAPDISAWVCQGPAMRDAGLT